MHTIASKLSVSGGFARGSAPEPRWGLCPTVCRPK